MSDNALILIQGWINTSRKKVRVIPRIDRLDQSDALLGITEHSALGTLINHTGGVSVADGLIRHFGGTNRFGLSIKAINEPQNGRPTRFPGILFIADDIFGGLFGINSGRGPGKPGTVLYLPPEAYVWEDLAVGHTEFLSWSLIGDTDSFYQAYLPLQPNGDIPFDKTISFAPPLWAGNLTAIRRETMLMDSVRSHQIRLDLLRELNEHIF